MEKEALADLKSDDRLKLKALYNRYRNEFLGFGRKYSVDADELADVYQEAFLALRKRAISGKLKQVNSSMKTYLFGIGKFMIFDILKKKNLHLPYESNLLLIKEKPPEIEIHRTATLTEEQKLLRQHFKQLGQKCREVLTLFYYRGLSIEEIAQTLGYNNANVVKAHKSRCLKALRQMIKS